jgi:hypothetical protein
MFKCQILEVEMAEINLPFLINLERFLTNDLILHQHFLY